MFISLKNYIINNEVVPIKTLLDFLVGGNEARARSLFVKDISEKEQSIVVQRTALLETYSKKDKEGKPISRQVGGGRMQYDIENLTAFNEDLKGLSDESTVISISDKNQKLLVGILDKIEAEESGRKFGSIEFDLYEELSTSIRNATEKDPTPKDPAPIEHTKETKKKKK